MKTLRTFTEHDWDAFAGAEEFADGSLPMIGERSRYTIVVSGCGGDSEYATVHLYGDNTDEWHTQQYAPKSVAVEVATLLLNAEKLDDVILAALGFDHRGKPSC